MENNVLKAVINNNNFFARCESSSAFDAGASMDLLLLNRFYSRGKCFCEKVTTPT